MSAQPAEQANIDYALRYANAGLQIFPLKPDKTPLIVRYHQTASTDPQQIKHWWEQWPNALIGHVLNPRVIILDIDPRHYGHLTWNALGPDIDGERRHCSGRGDGGTHHWYLRPEGKLSIAGLNAWAEQHQVGEPILDRGGEQIGWSAGIDLLTNTHRYTILPPSIHPDTGQRYWWDSKAEPGPMPTHLAQLLQTAPPPPPRPKPSHTATHSTHSTHSDSPADWYTETHTWNDVLEPHGWVIVRGNGHDDGSLWQHPNATAACSASIKHGCLFVYSDRTPFTVTLPNTPAGYTRFAAYAQLEHRGDQSDAATTIRTAMVTQQPPPGINPETGEIVADTSPYNLPDTFWNTRPALAHIRQAAHSRIRCADAVLLFALARITVLIPPTVTLPRIAGGKGSLNLNGAIVARSGGGKSSAKAVAMELIPLDHRKDVRDDIPPGSGEGLAELFLGMVPETDSNGKERQVKRQVRDAAFIYLDEGQAMMELGNRKGSTLMPQLRSAWSGETLGQANATQDTFRHLTAHSYRLSVMVGFQLEYAAGIIADAHGGTPQRFVFTTTTDPHIPETSPEWPGPLKFEVPPKIGTGTELLFDLAVHAEIENRARLIAQGRHQPDPLDSHADLVRMKLAAPLAILDGRLNVTTEDWELAGQIMRTSHAVRSWVIETAHQQATRLETARTEQQARREEILSDKATAKALTSGARSIANKVHRDGPIKAGKLMSAVASKHRQLVSFEDMIAYAVEEHWIVAHPETGWDRGESRPK